MFSRQELESFLAVRKIPLFRAGQIMRAIYREGKNSFEKISTLPAALRRDLAENFKLFPFTVAREVVSKNSDTVKTLFKCADGALIEGVLMRFKDGRNSVCVSSQVGCGLKCAFCATGTMGFKRNLTADEITSQVLYFDHWLKANPAAKKESAPRVDHVIFMGMGEPMLNYDAVISSIRDMNDPHKLGIAARHITVSTSGVIPGIKRLTAEPMQINLAVSLHAPDQKLREKLMPIALPYKIPALISALKDYVKHTRRRISYEYVMLKNINDSPETARELGRLIRGQKCHVNLIPYNETYLGFSNAGKSRIDGFREIVESYGIPVTVRVSLGQDISAACGQLATPPSGHAEPRRGASINQV